MSVNEIRSMRDAVPFVPFSMELSSGRVVEVQSHDHLFIPPAATLIVVANGHYSIFDLKDVVSLIVQSR